MFIHLTAKLTNTLAAIMQVQYAEAALIQQLLLTESVHQMQDTARLEVQ